MRGWGRESSWGARRKRAGPRHGPPPVAPCPLCGVRVTVSERSWAGVPSGWQHLTGVEGVSAFALPPLGVWVADFRAGRWRESIIAAAMATDLGRSDVPF